jgi:hypothetical protein
MIPSSLISHVGRANGIYKGRKILRVIEPIIDYRNALAFRKALRDFKKNPPPFIFMPHPMIEKNYQML